MKRAAIFFLALSIWPACAFGGWVEADRDGTRTLFSGGKVKEVSPDDPVWSVIDLRTGSLLLADSERRLFTETTVSDFCRTISEAVRASMAEMSDEERALMEEFIGQPADPNARGRVSVVDAGPGGTIAGLETELYRVLVDGILYQELWIAPNAPIMQEIRSADLRRLTIQVEQCTENLPGAAIGDLPEEDPAYHELEARGWFMRSVTFSEGEAIDESEVALHQQQAIPAAEFQPPPGFRQVPIRTFLAEE